MPSIEISFAIGERVRVKDTIPEDVYNGRPAPGDVCEVDSFEITCWRNGTSERYMLRCVNVLGDFFARVAPAFLAREAA